jgi:hypothetical protein
MQQLVYPDHFSGCHECAYLQLWTTQIKNSDLYDEYLCRWLKTLGIVHKIEYKATGIVNITDSNLQRIFEPHRACPLRRSKK